MIKTRCFKCKKALLRSPSKSWKRNFCSRNCYAKTRNFELKKRGEKFRYHVGHTKNSPLHYKMIASLLKNEGHPLWKGEKVSYRGLHQWVRRNKGKPTRCTQCSLESKKPRVIQWANVDGKYRRHLDDFIALCCSCHKLRDRQLQSIQDAPSATQSYSS